MLPLNRPWYELEQETVLDEGNIAAPDGAASDLDIDALLASFTTARESKHASEKANQHNGVGCP